MAAVKNANTLRIALFVVIFLAQIFLFKIQLFGDHSITLPFGWTEEPFSEFSIVCDGSITNQLESKGFPFEEHKAHAFQDACYGSENSISPILNFVVYALVAGAIVMATGEMFEGSKHE